MYRLGPHTFTQTDAERTLANFDDLWHELALGRDATVLAPLRPEFTGDTGTDLARVWAALEAAGPALRAAGQLPATATGTVAALHRSDGGVPKLPVDRVEVGWRGVEGDRQATRKHHGRPWQALCLWADEVIDAFAAAGHPIARGLAGENVTLRGLAWADVRPGIRLRLGTVLCEVSAFALPCSKNAAWFTGGRFDVMHHRHGPVSRAYATVIEPGVIAVGDAAILEP
jgi:MOSC domain-containing protein YiiM